MVDNSGNEHTTPGGNHLGKRSGFTPAEGLPENRRMASADSIPEGIEQHGTTMRNPNISGIAVVTGLGLAGGAATYTMGPEGRMLAKETLEALGPAGEMLSNFVQTVVESIAAKPEVAASIAFTIGGAAALLISEIKKYNKSNNQDKDGQER